MKRQKNKKEYVTKTVSGSPIQPKIFTVKYLPFVRKKFADLCSMTSVLKSEAPQVNCLAHCQIKGTQLSCKHWIFLNRVPFVLSDATFL